MKKIIVAVVMAVALAFGGGAAVTAGPASADSSWGP